MILIRLRTMRTIVKVTLNYINANIDLATRFGCSIALIIKYKLNYQPHSKTGNCCVLIISLHKIINPVLISKTIVRFACVFIFFSFH